MKAISPPELEDSLLLAETSPGTALDKVAAFLVAAFESRRERGPRFAFQPVDGVPPVELKRLLLRGQRDGSLAQRSPDTACALILACLQATVVIASGPEQQMWDAELIELLLAALAEPHPPDTVLRRGDAAPQRTPPPASGTAPEGGALAGLTLSSSTSNFSSEPGGIGGGESLP